MCKQHFNGAGSGQIYFQHFLACCLLSNMSLRPDHMLCVLMYLLTYKETREYHTTHLLFQTDLHIPFERENVCGEAEGVSRASSQRTGQCGGLLAQILS